MSSVTQILCLDVALGVASHYLWFKKYEPTSYSTIFTVVLSVTSPIVYTLHPLVSTTTRAFVLAEFVYLAALFTSIIVYRLSPFHPLASCPGPRICKVTKMWTAYLAWEGGLHRYYARLHEEYGGVVRIGPNELSVTEKDLFPHILGAQGMPKGPVWDNRRIVTSRNPKGHRNLHAVRDLKLHSELRKPWNKAFAKEPMKDYEAVLLRTASILVEKLREVCQEGPGGVVVDGGKWLSFYSFDSMGDMVFGRSFNLLKDGDPEGLWDTMEKSLSFANVAQHIPWVAGFTKFFPAFTRHADAFRTFAANEAKRRAKTEPLHKDLFFHLINNTDVEPGASVLPLVMADAVLAIFAGSDTSSTALSCALFYLARYPEWQDRVREEVDGASNSAGLVMGCVPEPDVLAELKVLNAVINETLRMQPAIPSLMQRAPAPQGGGKQLGNLFLPEGNTIQVPSYSVHRDPRYFSPKPTEFWPERWLADSGKNAALVETIIVDRSAFLPFSTGPGNCVGRNLALKQMRYVIAMLVRNFRFRLAEGYNPDRWEEELEDRSLMVKGELPVLMSVRDS